MTLSVAVTGASGFLGSAVTRKLREHGLEVFPVARRPMPGGVLVQDYAQTPAADVLIHLAADSDRARVQAAPEQHVREAGRILKALVAKPYTKILYSSSVVLYGDQIAAPRRPEEPVTPRDAYGLAKYEGEQRVLDSGRGTVARLTNLYGRGMSGGNVISTILGQMKEPDDTPLKVWDDAPIRDFLWMEDAADALTLMAMTAVAKNGVRAIYNLASGQGASVREIASLALEIAGRPSRRIVATRPSGRPSILLLDISDTTADFGWSPRTGLRDGLTALLRA